MAHQTVTSIKPSLHISQSLNQQSIIEKTIVKIKSPITILENIPFILSNKKSQKRDTHNQVKRQQKMTQYSAQNQQLQYHSQFKKRNSFANIREKTIGMRLISKIHNDKLQSALKLQTICNKVRIRIKFSAFKAIKQNQKLFKHQKILRQSLMKNLGLQWTPIKVVKRSNQRTHQILSQMAPNQGIQLLNKLIPVLKPNLLTDFKNKSDIGYPMK